MLDLERQLHDYAEFLHADVRGVPAGALIERAAPAHRVATPPRFRGVLVAAATAVIVLLAIGGFVLLLGHSARPVVNSTTTLPTPTTTLAPTTTTTPTTTSPPTTPVEAAAPLPAITWQRVSDPALIGGGTALIESMSIVDGTVYLTGADWDWANETTASAVILRSQDGTTWERLDDPAAFGEGQNIFGVASHNGTTVAVGLDCTLDESACLAAVWTSEDGGHTWTRLPHQEAFGSVGMLAVTSTDAGFIAVGGGVWTSPDGYAWTEVMDLPGTDVMRDVVATPGLIVAAGQRWEDGSETAIWTSTDGIEWTRVSDEDGDFEAGLGKVSWLSRVIATEQGFIAVGMAGSGGEGPVDFDAAAWRSTDGQFWHKIHPPLSSMWRSESAQSILQVNDWLVAVGGLYYGPHETGPGLIWFSHDGGLTWANFPNPDHLFGDWNDGYTNMVGVAELDGKIVVSGNDPTGPAVWIGTFESP